jgi:tripartite-type tricarboxylate transporter receptor subunit TctC
VKQRDVIEKFKLQGMAALGSSPEELQRIVMEEYERWSKVIPAIGIQAK